MSLDDDGDKNKIVVSQQNLTIESSSKLFYSMVTDYLLNNNDIKIIVDGKEIEGNSNILCACSTVFEKMLVGPMKEKDIQTIQIDRYKYDVICALVFHMHNQDINISHNNIINLMECANYYGYMSLHIICKTKLKSILTVNNAHMYYLESMVYGMDDAKEICEEFICSHIMSDDIIRSMMGHPDHMTHMITRCVTKNKKYTQHNLFCVIIKFIRYVKKCSIVNNDGNGCVNGGDINGCDVSDEGKDDDEVEDADEDDEDDDSCDSDDDNSSADETIHDINKLIDLIDIDKLTLNEVLNIEQSTRYVYFSAEKLRNYYLVKLTDTISIGDKYGQENSPIQSIELTTHTGTKQYKHNIGKSSKLVDFD